MGETFPETYHEERDLKILDSKEMIFRDSGLVRVCLSRTLPEEKKDAIKEAE